MPGHSFKFAAALQAAQACDNPVLIRIDTRAGHGAGKPTGKHIAELSDLWAFLVKSLKMKLPDDGQARPATRVAVISRGSRRRVAGVAGRSAVGPEPAVALLNRQDIRKILGEREFQALLAPAGVAQRASLGKILQADIAGAHQG